MINSLAVSSNQTTPNSQTILVLSLVIGVLPFAVCVDCARVGIIFLMFHSGI